MKHRYAFAFLCMAPLLLSACNQERDATGPAQQDAATPAEAAPNATAPATNTTTTATFSAAGLPDQAGMKRAFCALDRINSQAAAGQSISLETLAPARFVGWISDSTKQVPGHFQLVLSGPGTFAAESTAGGNRPDVARVLKADALAGSGFNVQASLADVAPGEYEVSLVVESDGEFERCATTTRVTVVQSPQ